jgi:hypothetical protein
MNSPARIVKQANRGEARPELFLDVRRALGETLHRLSAPKRGGSGAE